MAKLTCGPTEPTQVHVRIIVEIRKLRTHVLDTIIRIRATGLGHESLAARLPQVRGKVAEIVDLISGAIGVRGAYVEILMYVEDELIGRAVGVLHRRQCPARTRLKPADCSVVDAGEQDQLRRGPNAADFRHDGLQSVGPYGDVEIVGLIHEAKDDVWLPRVRLREL